MVRVGSLRRTKGSSGSFGSAWVHFGARMGLPGSFRFVWFLSGVGFIRVRVGSLARALSVIGFIRDCVSSSRRE